MEHLLILLILGADRFLRPRIENVIPNRFDLIADPEGYFAVHGGIRVGPRRYPVGSFVVGMPLGGLIGGLIGALILENESATWFLALIGGIAMSLLFRHLTRGGELHIVPSGVVFSYRGTDVLCPWVVIRPWGPPDHRDSGWTEILIFHEYVDRIILTKHGQIRARGAEVRCSHFVIDRPGFFDRLSGNKKPYRPQHFLVKDIFAVRPDELFPYVLQVARLLREESAVPPNKPDESANEADEGFHDLESRGV